MCGRIKPKCRNFARMAICHMVGHCHRLVFAMWHAGGHALARRLGHDFKQESKTKTKTKASQRHQHDCGRPLGRMAMPQRMPSELSGQSRAATKGLGGHWRRHSAPAWIQAGPGQLRLRVPVPSGGRRSAAIPLHGLSKLFHTMRNAVARAAATLDWPFKLSTIFRASRRNCRSTLLTSREAACIFGWLGK